MGCFSAIFVLSVLSITLAAETCPPANQLTPCTCDREGVNCMAASNTDQIRKAFRATFPFQGVSNVWIQDTPITDIPRDLFGNVMSLSFYIEMNQITTVAKEAFYPSKKYLSLLSFFGNNLTDFWYSSLKDFPQLSTLNLGRNKFRSIPANSFSHGNLAVVILSQNSISSIGENAFLNLPNLIKLDLTQNSLTTLGPLSLHHVTKRRNLEVHFLQNQITSVSSTAFEEITPMSLYLTSNHLTSLKVEAFGSLVKRMSQSGGVIDVSGNRLTCKGCDYSWIMNNQTVYYKHLVGFVCPDGTGILDLTRSSIGC